MKYSFFFVLISIDLAEGMKTSGDLIHQVGTSAESASEVDLEVQLALKSMVTRLLEVDGKRPRLHEVMSVAANKVNINKVAERLENKNLPEDVMALVKSAVRSTADNKKKKAQGPYSESSLTKAREVLNEMVESSQAELDSKIIDCQTFKESNRGTLDQISTDLARLGEQIADTERIKLEANNGISATKQSIKAAKELIEMERTKYLGEKAIKENEMAVKQSDLSVFQFITEFTKCQEESLLQLPHGKGHSQPRGSNRPQIEICEQNDEFFMNLGDKSAQQKYERMMTPQAQKEIRKILSIIRAEEEAQRQSLLQVGNTSTFAPVMSATIPVREGPSDKAYRKCKTAPPDCGLLHDKMSLMWGEFKDQVDELQHEMDENAASWDAMQAHFLQQLKILTNTLNTYSAQLAEATASLNADHEEQRNKLDQKRDVERAYEDYMRTCKIRIEWILYQDVCAIVVTRNAVLQESTVCPTSSIYDCDVEDWIPGPCSVSCDDSCPNPNDPFQCGGTQTMNRRIITKPNACGLKCPALTYQKKCNQIKCPVDCVMSEWSEYSKCTKDCESGVQQRTRDVMTNAKNGGEWCEVPTESRACNTGSCDRDCTLADWTEWSPCSMACTPGDDPGFTKRTRDVVVPIRGEGKCPTPDSEFRMETKDCNTQACKGNEECFAMQDLIVAVDGSGSIMAENFDILKEYVEKLVGRYKGVINEVELMKLAIVQFGNGEIMDDGTISNALKIMPLTSDIQAVAEAVQGMEFVKGFTNMAQALSLSERMFSEGGRIEAQSAILTITDGRPSFRYQTQQVVDKLESKGIQRFFITVQEEEGTETALMKTWASDPWWTNHLHIPGFLELSASNMTYVQEALVMFCPMSESPDVCHAILYQHGNFGGWRVDFPEGGYNMMQMINMGAPNDDASSIKVFGEDCVATLYQHWNFNGYSNDYPEGIYNFRKFLRQGSRNDDISSLRVWKDVPYEW